jgi:hypothetical protein
MACCVLCAVCCCCVVVADIPQIGTPPPRAAEYGRRVRGARGGFCGGGGGVAWCGGACLSMGPSPGLPAVPHRTEHRGAGAGPAQGSIEAPPWGRICGPDRGSTHQHQTPSGALAVAVTAVCRVSFHWALGVVCRVCGRVSCVVCVVICLPWPIEQALCSM